MTIKQFVENNLWAIIAGALALYTTYVIGGSETTHRMDRMDEKILAVEGEIKARRRFEQCAVVTIGKELPPIEMIKCVQE